MKYLTVITFYFLLHSVAVASPLKDFTAGYDLYHNGIYIGQSTRKLTTNDKQLTYTSVAKTAGFISWFIDITITETSKLLFKNKRLNFVSYDYNEQNKGKNEGYQLRLKNSQQLYNSYKKQLYPKPKKLHDTLGFTVAIMHDIQLGKREIEYTIAEKDELKPYTLKFIKKEELTTDNGKISTLKMEHYDPKTKARFTFWCAENMGFLPVRISNINQKGDENLLNLNHFNHKKIYLELDDEESD